MHDHNHQGCDADEGHTDDVQPDCQPAHGTAEQVERSLVLVQQTLVPMWRKTDWLDTVFSRIASTIQLSSFGKQNEGTGSHFTTVLRLKTEENKKHLPKNRQKPMLSISTTDVCKMGNSHEVYRYYMLVNI